jgi:uncharacterized protein (UPF0332 family)
MTNSPDAAAVFERKARQSLAAAESEYVNGRFDTCANRCYYACFQAAVAALIRQGTAPPVGGRRARWGHDFVQAQFAAQFIDRRKIHSGAFRDTLSRMAILRHTADYPTEEDSETQGGRAVRRAREFVREVLGGVDM